MPTLLINVGGCPSRCSAATESTDIAGRRQGVPRQHRFRPPGGGCPSLIVLFPHTDGWAIGPDIRTVLSWLSGAHTRRQRSACRRLKRSSGEECRTSSPEMLSSRPGGQAPDADVGSRHVDK